MAHVRAAVRIQRRSTATGAWADVKYLEQARQQNDKGYDNTEPNMYRVRTWAKQYDGSYANVWSRGFNPGS